MNREIRKHKRNKKIILFVVIVVLVISLASTVTYLNQKYTIQNIYVDGNVHYTADEIKEFVMGDALSGNSLYLSLKYRMKGIENIPFVSALDVSILSPDTIRIVVYEKALAGYVEYLGQYMYFDKDGTVVEASTEKTQGIPMVTGLSFDHVVLYQPLPVEQDAVFRQILDTTQMLTKYGLIADRIYFNENYEMTIYFENVRVSVGESRNMDDKFMMLSQIIGDLEGKKGVLRLENYTENTKSVTFEPDES